MKLIFQIALFLSVCLAFSQEKPAYQLYDREGHKANYGQMLKAAAKSEVVLFGEYHDNSVAHWLELELAKDLSAQKPLVMGAEMFESDLQDQVSQYLKGQIEPDDFAEIDRIWPNFKTDYRPLLDFAKAQHLPFIATNARQKYSKMVFKGGFQALDTLPAAEKKWLADLPVAYDATLSQYARMLETMGDDAHRGENLPKAQALKDATMAHFIFANFKPGSVFLHFNGTYHSNYFEGISWYLKKLQPKLKVMTIATVSQADVSKLEKDHFNQADFILVIDEDVLKTY